jgi:hypothetical protein
MSRAAKYLKNVDELMTIPEFERVTGINRATSISELRTLFTDVNLGEVFPSINNTIPNISDIRSRLQLDHYLFIEHIYNNNQLMDSSSRDLFQHVDTYLLHHAHRQRLQPMTLAYESVCMSDKDAPVKTYQYHNICLYYVYLCNYEVEYAIANIYDILKNHNRNS